MPKPRIIRERAQPSLFESAPNRPRWEDLPLEVHHRVIYLLSKLLSSRAARSLVTGGAEGGHDE